jgi:hypothetical protein
MGKIYTAKFPDGTKRVVADFAVGRAELFYEITRLVEEKVLHQPCGVIEMPYDEYEVDPEIFVRFFQRFWQEALAGDGVQFLYSWAQYAAGIVENITLTPLILKNRRGEVLYPSRYMLSERDFEDLLLERVIQRDKEIEGLPRIW